MFFGKSRSSTLKKKHCKAIGNSFDLPTLHLCKSCKSPHGIVKISSSSLQKFEKSFKQNIGFRKCASGGK